MPLLSILVPGLSCMAIMNALAIIIYDIREKMIPLYLIILFAGLSLIRAYLSHPDWQGLIIAVVIGFGILFILSLKQMIGLADCFLLPSSFAWIRLDEICIFLILCGFFGLISAAFWRIRYKEARYPFAPAILFSTSLILLS